MKIITLNTNDTNTSLRIPFEDSEILIDIKYLSVCLIWVMNISFKTTTYNGLKLSCGVNILRGHNLPFDFMVENNLNSGLDPYLETDMSDGSYTFLLLEREDIRSVRGYEVP